jgi:hypothetical protein
MVDANRDHIVPLPQWFLALRILQLVTAVVVLGLAGYGVTFISFDGIDLTLFSVSYPPSSFFFFFFFFFFASSNANVRNSSS